jgi:NADPH:quinone reductase-like Zn-dependent oxidoreductase
VTDGENTMKAIIQNTYGSPDVLELKDIDKPMAGDDELLVRVHAAGVDPGVWHMMTGLPYMIRLSFGLRRPKVRGRRFDIAGRVEAVGENVTKFKPGDEVFGTGDGSFAEYACVREARCAPKPGNLTFEQAAAVSISACTALQGLRDKGQVRPGQKVLIVGAAGGVGTFAVQLARAFGADVTGVCSTAKMDLVRSIGANQVIDYTRDDFTDGTRRYDLLLDTAGNRSLLLLRRALTPRGKLVIIGGEGGGRWTGGFIERLLRARILSLFAGRKLIGLSAKVNQKDLLVLKELIEAGKVTPVMDRTYQLSEVAEAIRYLEQGHASGKVVIAVC